MRPHTTNPARGKGDGSFSLEESQSRPLGKHFGREGRAGYWGCLAETSPQVLAARANYREKFPQDFEHGFLSGFTLESQQPCIPSGISARISRVAT
jgi:hypothetical protein